MGGGKVEENLLASRCILCNNRKSVLTSHFFVPPIRIWFGRLLFGIMNDYGWTNFHAYIT